MSNQATATPSGSGQSSPGGRLDSWKEIAGYLRREVRTVQRWEKSANLPVHRVQLEKQSAVYAYKSELDAWYRDRRPNLESESEDNERHAEGRSMRTRSQTLRVYPFLVGAVGALILILSIAIYFASKGLLFRVRSAPPKIKSLAVLPLQNLSGDATQDFFADSMTEELITDLSQITTLRVVSHTSIARYKKTDKSLQQIAGELNVDAIVEGSVLRSGDQVRITAQLIYAPNDSNLWAQSYDRNLQDVLAMQSSVASAIASQIQVKMTPNEQARLRDVRPLSRKALDANLDGRFHLQKCREQRIHKDNKERVAEGLRVATADFEQAIREDPNYAPAYVGLSEALLSRRPTPQMIEKAKAALSKALTLDDAADAHFAMANLRMQYEYDWSGAEVEFKRALRLNPNSAEGHTSYADYLGFVGRLDEEKAEREVAQELDPNQFRLSVGGRYGFRSHTTLDEDRQYLDERAPNDGFARGALAADYLRVGRYKEAVEEWEKALAVYGYEDLARVLRAGSAKGDYKSALWAWAQSLDKLSDTEDIPTFLSAFVYSALGDKDRALARLQKAYDERSWYILDLKDDVIWDPIRADPRFAELMRRMGLLH
jgi:TolB-like protein